MGPDVLVATAAYQPEPKTAAAARRFVRDTRQSATAGKATAGKATAKQGTAQGTAKRDGARLAGHKS